MNIALTGGTGNLGRVLLPALLEAGHSVRLLVRPSANRTWPVWPPGVTPVEVALTDPVAVASALGQTDLVIHAAAPQTGSLEEQHASTVVGTQVVLEAMQMNGIRRLVGLSSLAVYHYQALLPGSTLNETSPLELCPTNRDPYTQCKLVQDGLFRQHAGSAPSFSTVVLRPGIFYSQPNQWPIGLGKGIGASHWALLGPLNPHHRLPLVHVEDVAQGVVAAVNHLLAAPTENATVEVFNLVEPEAPLATDLLAALRAQPHSPTCVRLPWRLHHTLAHVLSRLEIMLARPLPIPGLLRPDWMASRFCQLQFDVRRAQTVLGWEAKHRILNDLNTQRA